MTRAASLACRVAALALLATASGAASCASDGARIYQQNCAQCHGSSADGQGVLADRFTPRPANLVASQRTDDYKYQIITLGGAALGRSEVMPQWGLELSVEEIQSLVQYLRSVVDERGAGREDASRPAAGGRPHG
jgi:mono/diheme cytochrome c family protein